jgi:acetyl-CoA acetyltransferase
VRQASEGGSLSTHQVVWSPKGHPVGATGLAQIHELVTQLRWEAGKRQIEGARLALAENGGGLEGIEEAVACITILGR